MINFDRINSSTGEKFVFQEISWKYHRFVFSVTEDYASIACPINREEEEWRDAILMYFWEFLFLLYLFFYLIYALDKNFNNIIVKTLFKIFLFLEWA
jgi:hypothetical protein